MIPTGVHDAHAPEIDQNATLCYVCEADLTEKKGKNKQDSKSGKEKIVCIPAH